MARKAEKVIDFRDSLTTISLLKLTQVFGQMNPSEILEIRGADAITRQDLFKVLPSATYEVIEVEDGDAEENMHRVQIRKCR